MSLASSFARTGFARFINSTAGRVLRIVAGAAMMVYGYLHINELSGIVLLVVGVIPLIAGLMGYCLISALLGGPLSGAKVMAEARKP